MMIRTAVGIAVAMGLAYMLLPAFRGWIVAAAPILLLLLCPLSMLLMMMFGMRGESGRADKAGKQNRDKG